MYTQIHTKQHQKNIQTKFLSSFYIERTRKKTYYNFDNIDTQDYVNITFSSRIYSRSMISQSDIIRFENKNKKKNIWAKHFFLVFSSVVRT